MAVSTETRQRILDASQRLFASRGYRGTTTKDIAEAAAVSEPTVFRHFNTKAALFEEAVITPVHDFMSAWVDEWRDQPWGTQDPEAKGLSFFAGLLDVLQREDKLIVALVAALAFEEQNADLAPELRSRMSVILDGLEGVFQQEVGRRGYHIDPSIAPRLIVAMVLGVAVHGDWLFPRGGEPDREELVTEMAKLTVWGLQGERPH